MRETFFLYFSDLSSNEIQSVTESSFAGLSRLRSLDLSHNAIECVEDFSVGNLRDLQFL